LQIAIENVNFLKKKFILLSPWEETHSRTTEIETKSRGSSIIVEGQTSSKPFDNTLKIFKRIMKSNTFSKNR
jgi:hypothetical protein